MNHIPLINPDFRIRAVLGSPEHMLIKATDSIIDVGVYDKFFQVYTESTVEIMEEYEQRPLYYADGIFTKYPDPIQPPSHEVYEEIWRQKLLSRGKPGEKMLDSLGSLKSSLELLIGKQISFYLPYKRELEPFNGYINGSLARITPGIYFQHPDMFVQADETKELGRGIYFHLLQICNVAIS